MRGGRAADQRAFLAVLAALAPTPPEYAARVRDLMALLDGLPAMAGHAQQVLAGLDEAGLVEPELVTEASAVVLFRAEKKLVRAQLAWLEQAARSAPERSGPVALAAAEAFGHPDSALQERALNLVARRLKTAGEAVLPELRLAAEALNPVHHARAGALFGAVLGGSGEDDTAWDELLPPVPEPAPLGEPLATPAEVAEELAVLLAAGRPGVAVFERVLDGLVRHAHRDRPALAAALEPVLRAHPGRTSAGGRTAAPPTRSTSRPWWPARWTRTGPVTSSGRRAGTRCGGRTTPCTARCWPPGSPRRPSGSPPTRCRCCSPRRPTPPARSPRPRWSGGSPPTRPRARRPLRLT